MGPAQAHQCLQFGVRAAVADVSSAQVVKYDLLHRWSRQTDSYRVSYSRVWPSRTQVPCVSCWLYIQVIWLPRRLYCHIHVLLGSLGSIY
jgi:hypothetical protein